jgi:hypothetical protein
MAATVDRAQEITVTLRNFVIFSGEGGNFMLFRILACLIGLFDITNGLYMAISPHAWFATAPGAMATGPFNPHFVTDVGFGYLVGGIALVAFAWNAQLRRLALGASGFLGLHALFHLSHAVGSPAGDVGTDVAVALPGLIGLALCWPKRNYDN